MNKIPPRPGKNEEDDPELDPNNGDTELDKLKGQTTNHAKPARLEDEGQPGG